MICIVAIYSLFARWSLDLHVIKHFINYNRTGNIPFSSPEPIIEMDDLSSVFFSGFAICLCK